MRCLLALVALSGCGAKQSCLDGDCPTPCAKLFYACEPKDADKIFAGLAVDTPAAYRLQFGNAGNDDIVISNGIVTAAISVPTHDNDLAPTGGNLIDYGPAGGVDDITISYQLAGILPDDAFAYHSLDIEYGEERVAVTLLGTLDGRPDVKVATRYELGLCDPGLRVRSELFNGSSETHAWFVADTLHHGSRRVLPFSPGKDRGYLAPELDLLELSDQWQPHELDAGAAPNTTSPGYAAVSCTEKELFGVDDPEVAAMGTPIEIVEPGDTLILERFLVTAGAGQGPRPARAAPGPAETRPCSTRVPAFAGAACAAAWACRRP